MAAPVNSPTRSPLRSPVFSPTSWEWDSGAVADTNLYYIPHYGQSLAIGTDPDLSGGEVVTVEGDAKAITGATNANPVVITCVGHGFSNLDEVIIRSVGGMTQINELCVQVRNVTTDTFELYKIDGETTSLTTINGTAYGVYTTGGTAQKTANISANAYMFNGGVVPNYYDPDQGNVNTALFAATMKELVLLRERAGMAGDLGETLASGVAAKLSVKSLQASTARGAMPVASLARGTIHYQNTYLGMMHAKIYGESAGHTVALGPMIWKQGENDGQAGTAKATYIAAVEGLYSNLAKSAEHAFLTSDQTKFKMITDQLCVSTASYGVIAVAAIDMHRNGNGVICLGPTYGPEYEYTAANDVHLTAVGYRRVGEKFGLAIASIIAGNGWNPCYITNAVRSGTTITVTVHVPSGDLVKDTSLVSAATNDGFTYTGATITNVSVGSTAGNTCTITITINASAGGTLRYAYANGTASYVGATGGARGNIRDSATAVTEYDGTNLYNWLCADEWVLA